MKKLHQILISFPPDALPLVTDAQLSKIREVIADVCKSYEASHPGRVMWPFGEGALMLTNPFFVDEETPMKFDDTAYHFEVAERAK